MKQSSVILLVENDKDYIYVLEQAFRKANIRNPLRIARYGNHAILYLRGVGICAGALETAGQQRRDREGAPAAQPSANGSLTGAAPVRMQQLVTAAF